LAGLFFKFIISGKFVNHNLTNINQKVLCNILMYVNFMPVNPCLFINVYFIHVCFRSVHLYLFYSTFLFQIGILKQFTFTSKLQRMSVITRQNNLNGDNFIVYSKGSPEMISSLSLPYTGTSVTVARTSFQILEIFLGKIMSIPFFKYPILKCSYTTGASEKTS